MFILTDMFIGASVWPDLAARALGAELQASHAKESLQSCHVNPRGQIFERANECSWLPRAPSVQEVGPAACSE